MNLLYFYIYIYWFNWLVYIIGKYVYCDGVIGDFSDNIIGVYYKNLGIIYVVFSDLFNLIN